MIFLILLFYKLFQTRRKKVVLGIYFIRVSVDLNSYLF